MMMRLAQGFMRTRIPFRVAEWVFGICFIVSPSMHAKHCPLPKRDDRRHKVNFPNNRYFSIYYNKSVHVLACCCGAYAQSPFSSCCSIPNSIGVRGCVCALQLIFLFILHTTTERRFSLCTSSIRLRIFTNSTLSRPYTSSPRNVLSESHDVHENTEHQIVEAE